MKPPPTPANKTPTNATRESDTVTCGSHSLQYVDACVHVIIHRRLSQAFAALLEPLDLVGTHLRMARAAVLVLAVLTEKVRRAGDAFLLDPAVIATSTDVAGVLAHRVHAQHVGIRKALALLADLAHRSMLAVAHRTALLAVTLAPSLAAARFTGHVSAEVLPWTELAGVLVFAMLASKCSGRASL